MFSGSRHKTIKLTGDPSSAALCRTYTLLCLGNFDIVNADVSFALLESDAKDNYLARIKVKNIESQRRPAERGHHECSMLALLMWLPCAEEGLGNIRCSVTQCLCSATPLPQRSWGRGVAGRLVWPHFSFHFSSKARPFSEIM